MTGSQSSENNLIGVELSGSTLRAALVSSKGIVRERVTSALDVTTLRDQIAEVVNGLKKSGAVDAIGIGMPGLIDREQDKVLISKEFPSLPHGNLQKEISAATGLRVELENDANAAAYGEFLVGAGKGSQNLFYVTIGSGVGGAIILGGKLWLGASGYAGEFGHTVVVDAAGELNYLESVAAAPNIVRRTHERLNRDSTSSLSMLAVNRDFTVADIVREARAGDDFAALMIERTGRYIGSAIASVINLLNIERIVFGGPVMEAGELIMDAIIHEAEQRAFQPCFDVTSIVAGTLGLDAVVIGSALLARDASI